MATTTTSLFNRMGAPVRTRAEDIAPGYRILRAFGIASLCLVLAALLLPAASVFPNGILDDDAYFYAQVAWNVSQLGFSTFDGLTTTSGFHLLWAGLLGAVSGAVSLITTEKQVHLFAYLSVSMAFAVTVAWHAAPRMPERICAFAMFFLASLVMETVLLSGLLLFVFVRLMDDDRPLGDAWYDYAALFLIPLTRIDSTVVPGIVLGALLFLDPRRAILLGTALGSGVLAHFIAMYALFGEFFSVSSLLKATRTGNFERDTSFLMLNLTASKAQMVRIAVTALLFTLAALNVLQTENRARRLRKAAILAGLAAFFAGPFLLIVMRSWYFLPIHIGLLWLATRSDVRPALRSVAPRLTGTLAVATALVYATGAMWYQVGYRADQANAASFVKEIARRVPPGGRAYQIDGAGYVGFFAGRSVVNGDGLMNDYAYARRLADGSLGGYFAEKGICYVIANKRAEADRPMLVDHFGLRVEKKDATLLFRVPGDGRNKFSDFALWKLNAPRCG